MRTNWGLTAAVGGLAMLGGFVAGCQTYDFEPVEPLFLGVERQQIEISARVLPPNLMILLDKSDSMDRPEDPNLPACQTGNPAMPVCGTGAAVRCNETLCPTRLSRLREAMSDFLAVNDGTFPFRVGLAAYPVQGQCSPTPRLFVSLPTDDTEAAMASQATTVRTWIQNLFAEDSSEPFGDTETAGGTPTAASLRHLTTEADLMNSEQGRSNFVLLLTDGLPNCNDNHPVTPETCRCALPDPTQCFPTVDNPRGAPEGCLDDNNSVAAVTELRDAGVKTIVVGLGSETASGMGPETLNAMGRAGGFTRSCRTNDDCGEGDSCNVTTGVCQNAFYQASNGAALGEALRQIAEKIPEGDPCELEFSSAPSEGELIFVKVNGAVVPATEGGTTNWTFDASTKIFAFEGPICEQIKSSTTANPVSVDVAVIQSR